MTTDKLFIFTSPDNIFLFIKAPDIDSANNMALNSTIKKFEYLQTAQNWSFMDVNGISEEQYNNMEAQKRQLEKWNKFREVASSYLNVIEELNISGLESETISIQNFVDNSVANNINTYKTNLETERGSSVLFNRDKL